MILRQLFHECFSILWSRNQQQTSLLHFDIRKIVQCLRTGLIRLCLSRQGVIHEHRSAPDCRVYHPRSPCGPQHRVAKHIEGESPYTLPDIGSRPGRDLKVLAELGHIAIGFEGAARFAAMARIYRVPWAAGFPEALSAG